MTRTKRRSGASTSGLPRVGSRPAEGAPAGRARARSDPADDERGGTPAGSGRTEGERADAPAPSGRAGYERGTSAWSGRAEGERGGTPARSRRAEGDGAGTGAAPGGTRVAAAQPGRAAADRAGFSRTGAGDHLRAAARAQTPVSCGTPAEAVDDEERRVWAAAFRLAARRRFQRDTPLAEISRTVTAAVRAHAAAFPVLDVEMLVRDALGETVPVRGIDSAVLTGVHLLLFASLADELALGDGELDALIAEAEELAVARR
jgi:hypothetical protein